MNYKTVEALLHPKESEKNCLIYNVIETTTSQVIKTFTDQKEAKDYMRFLNLGGAFDGFTPSFLAKKVENFGKKSVK